MKFPSYPVIDMAATGQRIRKLRQEKGIKVTEISQYMGFTEPQAVYKWQRGESLPSLDNLYALSRILETTMEDILVGDDEMSSRYIWVRVRQRTDPWRFGGMCTSGLVTAAFFCAKISIETSGTPSGVKRSFKQSS